MHDTVNSEVSSPGACLHDFEKTAERIKTAKTIPLILKINPLRRNVRLFKKNYVGNMIFPTYQ